MNMLSWIMALVWLPLIAGMQDTVGDYFESNSVKTSGSRGVFLFEHLAIPESVVYKFSGYCVINETARIQIWKPLDVDAKVYTLKQEWTLVPSRIPGRCGMEFYEKDDYIFVTKGDRFALYNEHNASPLAYRLNAAQDARTWAVSTQVPFKPGDEVDFDAGISMPYEFSLEIYYDTDPTIYTQEGRRSVKSTTISTTIPPVTIPAFPADEGSVLYMGNSLGERLTYHATGARGSFLIQHLDLRESKLLSFLIFAASNGPVWLQVWRRTEVESQFTLVGQIRADITEAPKAIEIVLPEGEFIDVEDGDKLGFTNEDDAGPIGYTFQKAADYPQPYFASLPNKQATENLNDVVTFETIGMPFDFAIGAKTDTDIEKYAGITRPPRNSMTDSTDTQTTVIDEVINFKEDRSVGHSLLVPTTKQFKTPGKQSWVLAHLEFPVDATVTGFAGYFVGIGSMQYEVWRKVATVDGSVNMTLIGSKFVMVAPPLGFQQVNLHDDEKIVVQKGDLLGFSNSKDSLNPIGYQFSPAAMLYATPGEDFGLGSTLEFESQTIPYVFAYAASYELPSDVDDASSTPAAASNTDHTATVPTVPTVSTKQSSPVTSSTPTSAAPSSTSKTRDPQNAASTSDKKETWLETPAFLLALLVWLILLSLLFILLLVVLLYKRRSPDYVDYMRHVDSRPNSSYSNFGLKVGENVDYFNPSVGMGSSKRNGNATFDCEREA